MLLPVRTARAEMGQGQHRECGPSKQKFRWSINCEVGWPRVGSLEEWRTS